MLAEYHAGACSALKVGGGVMSHLLYVNLPRILLAAPGFTVTLLRGLRSE